MKFESLAELEKRFKAGKITSLPDNISVDGVMYKFMNATPYEFNQIVGEERKKPMVVYSLDRKKSNMEVYDEKHINADSPGHQDRLVLVWAANRLRVHPAAAKFVPKGRISQTMVREAEIEDERIIGHRVAIVLTGFNGSKAIEAKVDTGAAMSSLDANNVKVDRQQGIVAFNFGDRRVTMPLVDQQAVKTADNGVEYRPVVAFNVVLPNSDPNKKNRTLSNIQFNLNDRSGMPDKILLGQNFIKAGNFVVMDKGEEKKVIESELNESIDWDSLQKEFEDIEFVEENDVVDQLINLLREIK